MAADSSLPLQQAIIGALKGDGALGALVGGRIYDAPPQHTGFPYISLGVEQGEPFEAQALDGWDVSWQVDCWSRRPGRVEVRQIMAAISAALHDGPLLVSGHHLVVARLAFQTALDDPDGVTTHGVQRFEFITHI